MRGSNYENVGTFQDFTQGKKRFISLDVWICRDHFPRTEFEDSTELIAKGATRII